MNKGAKIFGFAFLFVLITGGIAMNISNIYPIALGIHDEIINEDDIAINGYDVVAYFTQETATKGKNEFISKFKSLEWKFSSAKNLTLFEANPDKYLQRFNWD